MSGEPLPPVLTVEFDQEVFSLVTVKKALYRLSADLTADVAISGPFIRCCLRPAGHLSGAAADELPARLRREVLDQDLREKIADETKAYRDVILGYVFSKTGLQGND